MKDYAFFWGCQIPARFPFVELSTRKTLDALGVRFRDIDGFTCCPQAATVRLLGDDVWLAAAAHNLAVAEREGLDVLTGCNGCYQTLKTVNARLNTNPQLLERVNEMLSGSGLEYGGDVRVAHLLEVLHDEVSPAAIARKVTEPLVGVKVGVHYGCHLLRPSDTLRFDDPLEPSKFENLVRALGAEPVDYETKLLCCGGLLSDTGSEEAGLKLARTKLAEVEGLGLDVLCLMCPACFIQYDSRQALLRARGEELGVPIVFYTELLGLALGMKPEELGLNRHAIKTDKFLQKWKLNMDNLESVRELFDLQFLIKCSQCKACVEECPAARAIENFTPTQIVDKLLDGGIQELLDGSEIWYCLDCETCRELCPWKIGMSEIVARLRQMAAAANRMPAGLRQAARAFKETGAVAEVIEVSRKRLGLPPSKATGYEQLRRILDAIEEGR